MSRRHPISALIAAAVFGLSAPALAQTAEAPTVQTDAREQAPAALIGAWKADIAASRYAGAAPQMNVRTFAYAGEGKVLVTSLTRNARGEVAMLHWAVQLDGTPGLEYMTSNRSTPTSLVALKKQDERTLILTVWKHGTVTLRGRMELSNDGRTLTYAYGGDGPQNVIVYHRWDMAS